ncbi:hexokinase-domain-containing protein [Dichotomocladium elegans]|nr:hexokinase-domain-containing protein [Dichotomocladium elegans]
MSGLLSNRNNFVSCDTTDDRSRRRRSGNMSAMPLMHGSAEQVAALQEIQELFRPSHEQLQICMHEFEQEIKAGLGDESVSRTAQPRSSDLKMIPSYVTGYPTGNEKGTYLALEISGVDIYVCQVKLKGEGGKLAINQYQYEIPDDLTTGNDFGVLVDYVADCVADFQQRVSGHPQEVYSMAMCLGFAVRQTGLDRGTIVALEHGFEFPNVIGSDVVELFTAGFQSKGLNVRIVAIANDAVCTLLAHAYQHPATRIGIVHNIGTNCAYYDKVSNMRKFLAQQHNGTLQSPAGQDMIINTEWCTFDLRHLPVSRYDQKVDMESNNPGRHIFEKMTTGMYLGEIVRQILVDLLDHRILTFTATDGDGEEEEEEESCLLRIPYHFDTSYMYVCEADDPSGDLEDTRVVLEEMCKVGETSLADREIVKKVCEFVGQRAASLVGASIAGVVKYMVESGIGLDSNGEGSAIAISGDVYKDYPSFHPRVCETLKALIPEHVSSKISVGIVKFSRIVGAAIVAMMAEKMDQKDVEML